MKLQNFTIKEFKNEFRLICSDTWGDCMEAWFECSAHMYNRGIKIPSEWEYSHGLGKDPREKDSYWYDLFKVTYAKDLKKIGNFLFRYSQFLKHKGIDY